MHEYLLYKQTWKSTKQRKDVWCFEYKHCFGEKQHSIAYWKFDNDCINEQSNKTSGVEWVS